MKTSNRKKRTEEKLKQAMRVALCLTLTFLNISPAPIAFADGQNNILDRNQQISVRTTPVRRLRPANPAGQSSSQLQSNESSTLRPVPSVPPLNPQQRYVQIAMLQFYSSSIFNPNVPGQLTIGHNSPRSVQVDKKLKINPNALVPSDKKVGELPDGTSLYEVSRQEWQWLGEQGLNVTSGQKLVKTITQLRATPQGIIGIYTYFLQNSSSQQRQSQELQRQPAPAPPETSPRTMKVAMICRINFGALSSCTDPKNKVILKPGRSESQHFGYNIYPYQKLLQKLAGEEYGVKPETVKVTFGSWSLHPVVNGTSGLVTFEFPTPAPPAPTPQPPAPQPTGPPTRSLYSIVNIRAHKILYGPAPTLEDGTKPSIQSVEELRSWALNESRNNNGYVRTGNYGELMRYEEFLTTLNQELERIADIMGIDASQITHYRLSRCQAPWGGCGIADFGDKLIIFSAEAPEGV